jgi:hypothetical protein
MQLAEEQLDLPPTAQAVAEELGRSAPSPTTLHHIRLSGLIEAPQLFSQQ